MARSLRIVLVAVVTVLAVGAATLDRPAQAAELDKKAKADAKEAMRFYKEGNYEDAAKIFLKLSIAYPDMLVFVRNLGACYYYMRRYEPALSNLRDYVHRKKDIAADDRAEVEGWIGEMERLRDQAAAPVVPPVAPGAPVASPAPATPSAAASAPAAPPIAAAPTPAAPTVTPMPETPAATPEPPVRTADSGASGAPTGYPPAPYPYSAGQPAPSYPYPSPQAYPPGYPAAPYPNAAYPATDASAPPPRPPQSSGSGRKTVAWILGAVGLGSAATGAYCTVMALDRFSKVEKKYDPSVEKEGNNFAKAQWVGYGLGAALITTAIIVGATGSSSSSVALAPAIGPGGAGAVMAGSF